MKRSLRLTFRDDESWATVQESLRRLRKICLLADGTDADHIAFLCREYLDRPTVQSDPN